MTLQIPSIPEKLANAEAAMKSGLLKNYAPASSLEEAALIETVATKSWGSAMRR
jgi:hypothetical protein